MNEDDRRIARKIYLKEIKKKLNILATIENEKPNWYAITETKISKRSERESKNV